MLFIIFGVYSSSKIYCFGVYDFMIMYVEIAISTRSVLNSFDIIHDNFSLVPCQPDDDTLYLDRNMLL